MPATIPTTAPLMSLEILTVISRLASSISSRTSRLTRSVTSWTAWPSSEVSFWWSAMSVEDPLEDSGEDEGADERGADHHLGPLGRRRQLVEPGDRGRGRAAAGGVRTAPRGAD